MAANLEDLTEASLAVANLVALTEASLADSVLAAGNSADLAGDSTLFTKIPMQTRGTEYQITSCYCAKRMLLRLK